MKYRCQMCRVDRGGETPQDFVIHMHLYHGVTISVTDILYLDSVNRSPPRNRSLPKRQGQEKRGRGRPKQQPTLEHLARIGEMKQRRASGQCLSEIGKAFQMSGERVRQLIQGMPRPQPLKTKPWPRTYFRRVMTQWLREAGYRKCAVCKSWTSDFSAKSNKCRPCNRQSTRNYYRTQRGREKLKAAAKRYAEDNPDKVRKWARDRYRRLVSTPEGRVIASQRERAKYERQRGLKGGKDCQEKEP